MVQIVQREEPMFLINLQGNDPIFEQIRKQIIKFIEIGVLVPNDKLPSVRILAQELGINPNTVAKAYQLLEEEGIVYTYQKKGVFVSDKIKLENPNQVMKKEFENVVRTLLDSGLSKEELKIIIDMMGEKI